MATSTTEYCLRWVNYEPNAVKFFSSIYQKEALADVTLVSHEGNLVKAHKVVLAACSPYFQTIFENNTMNHPHPVVVLKDISYLDLEAVLCFVYKGVVNVAHERINGVLLAATSLQVKGLSSSSGTPSNEAVGSGYSGTQNSVEPVRNVPTPPVAETKSTDTTVSLPETLDHGTSGSTHPRKKPRVSTQDSVSKSDNNSSFYEVEQRVGHDTRSSATKNDDQSGTSNGSADLPSSRLLEALTQQTSSNSSGDEFQNIDSSFSATLRNVKVEEELPDDLCEVGFEEPDGEELMGFDEHSSLVDLVLPSTSAAAQHFLSNNNELVVHPTAERDYPLNPDSESADSNSKHNIIKPSPNGSNRKSRRVARSFKCEICGAAYTCMSHLLRHRASHSDPRFQCEFCSRSFTRKDVLTRHLKEVHYLKCSVPN